MIAERRMLPDDFHHPVQLATDAGTIILGGGWLSASILNKIHGLEGVVSGALIIVLLVIRVAVAYRAAVKGVVLNDRDEA